MNDKKSRLNFRARLAKLISGSDEKDDNAPSDAKWWSDVVTDKTRGWILIGSILAAIIFPIHANFIWVYSGINNIFWFSSGLSLFFGIFAITIMYQLYNERRTMETEAWQLKIAELPEVTAEIDAKFFYAYQDTVWIKHVTPFALVIYIGVISIGSANIFFTHSFTTWHDYKILLVLLSVDIIITIKFINDIYGLLRSFKKAKGLLELTY